MYGRKGYQLVKDFASGEKGQLKPFNSKLFDETIEESRQNQRLIQSLMRKMEQEGLDVQNNRNADYYGALVHHLSLIRNKRCLMAYVHNRADIVRDLGWRVGLELPPEIQEKLTTLEKEYFKNHSAAIKSYMGKAGIDLNVDMVPPKDPYIKVRVVGDIDDGIVMSDKTTNFARHSMHFLKRTDAEPYIARKWASTISVVASSLFAFIIVFQIPLFRVACRNKTCESPLEVISSQLVESELVPSPLVKTLLYPGAIAKSLLRGSPLPSYHNLFHFYHFDHLNTPSSSSDDDIRHLEVFAGCCLCLLGALLSIFKPRRLTFIGTLLIYWGLLRDILLFNSSARVYPTLFLASLSSFLSIRSDVRKIIQCCSSTSKPLSKSL
ncbi:hypothetical protein HID58_006223 [Brassica napus]|uniref:GINS subunit domain-containing protein n=1 Tax=Brassica napus TaxID=3708 RepID=A0ABQ8EAW3_BRANA|nr:hypothetical protein HID58_006223 [Brassica napus]